MTDRRVSLGEFILVSELLERAYAGPTPTPDYLQHECERAEDALAQLGAKRGITGDAALAKLFALSYRDQRQTRD
jgi:hypothetical protein